MATLPPNGVIESDIDLNAHAVKAVERAISWSIPNERTIENVTLYKHTVFRITPLLRDGSNIR